ncbi:cell envelope biogenesis protein OmpA [Enterobacter sp. SA187]|uniref:cell envelope biogenesis protein OmpA n=1 Tax=Enterobacter sp. SA187 TaxID=1914861 RepID=UPI00093475E4|nr:cell envelope biogenesis protein OmpA [Enterobacter sp. SA187]
MKKYLVALLCVVSASSFAETYKNYPEIPAPAVGFATEVISYQPGPNVAAGRDDPKLVLGAPAFYSPGKAPFSLGTGGNVVLGFSPDAIKKSGTPDADFYIYEVGQYESWDAYLSNDGTNWIKATASFSNVNPQPASSTSFTRGSVIGYDVDLISGTADSFRYVKIVDTSLSTYAGSGGSDIDAVVVTSAKALGHDVLVDTDSRNGKVYNLYQNDVTGEIGVKIIYKDSKVTYVPFSTDNSLKAIALSLQGDFNCDDEKDINVLATRSNDNVQVNILKQQDGTSIKTIDNDVTK